MVERSRSYKSGHGKGTEHAYPRDLAAFVAARWEDDLAPSDSRAPVPHSPPVEPLPEVSVLEEVLSTCYQARLLREENQPILFTLALRPHEAFPPEGGPPDGLQRLEFPEPGLSTSKNSAGSPPPRIIRAP